MVAGTRARGVRNAWGLAVVLTVVAAAVAHGGVSLAMRPQEAYPLTIYPMFASHPPERRQFYDVEAFDANGTSLGQVAAGAMLDPDHELPLDSAILVYSRLVAWHAKGCVGDHLFGAPASCAGSPVAGWSPPADIVAAWQDAAPARLGTDSAAAFAVVVRSGDEPDRTAFTVSVAEAAHG